jgi:hypothetical protein
MTAKTLQFRGAEITNMATIVPGHAILRYGLEARNPTDDSAWILQPFQKGEPKYYIEHIEAAVKRSHEDGSLVIFSGGFTRQDAGPARSEAQSYWHVAEYYNWFGMPDVAKRAVTELGALDSFQNPFYGMLKHKETTNEYPDFVAIMGWGFKEPRFKEHMKAIRYPEDKFKYIGVNNPADLIGAMKGEQKALAAFAADPYGTHPDLSTKRKERNQFNMYTSYESSCPEVVGLLRHMGPELYTGPLPWAAALRTE